MALDLLHQYSGRNSMCILYADGADRSGAPDRETPAAEGKEAADRYGRTGPGEPGTGIAGDRARSRTRAGLAWLDVYLMVRGDCRLLHHRGHCVGAARKESRGEPAASERAQLPILLHDRAGTLH